MRSFLLSAVVFQAVLLLRADDYDLGADVPDLEEMTFKINKRMERACEHIEELDHGNITEAIKYAKAIENAIPIKELGLKDQEGLFHLGSRGLIHYLIDEYDFRFKEDGKEDEFMDWCIEFTRKLVKKFGL